MTVIWNNIHSFYLNWLHPTFASLISTLTKNPIAIYILVAVIIILSIIRARIKILKLQKVFDLVCGIIVILLLIVAFYSFSPAINKFFDSIKVPTTTKSTNSTQNAPAQNSNSSNQTQKQLYYSVGCYDCYKDSCVKNGYSYGGYDESYYNYIRSICQSCSCNSYRAQSLWR